MKFEHLIQINDPLNPLIDPLTRNQLWRGLVSYVEDPVPFVESLDSSTIKNRTENCLKRELAFGRLVVRDQVDLTHGQRIHIATEATPEIPAGTLTLTIEEPSDDLLFVRFQYQTFPQPHQMVERQYEEVMKNAYVEAGIDIIKRIRDYAEQGRLENPLQ